MLVDETKNIFNGKENQGNRRQLITQSTNNWNLKQLLKI